jgi:hypothetical protein
MVENVTAHGVFAETGPMKVFISLMVGWLSLSILDSR